MLEKIPGLKTWWLIVESRRTLPFDLIQTDPFRTLGDCLKGDTILSYFIITVVIVAIGTSISNVSFWARRIDDWLWIGCPGYTA